MSHMHCGERRNPELVGLWILAFGIVLLHLALFLAMIANA